LVAGGHATPFLSAGSGIVMAGRWPVAITAGQRIACAIRGVGLLWKAFIGLRKMESHEDMKRPARLKGAAASCVS
jgi:hypothetical protein